MVGQQEIRVLIVDDDEIDRQGVTRYVEKTGLPYALRTAGSKAEALELLRDADSYDVVLLDYELGDGTGLELLSSVGTTPAVIITGNGSEQIAAEAMRRGAYDYLVKDPDRYYLELLPLTIENVLKRRRSEVELREAHAKIKDLHGILPICWNCKKIRDDQGYWDEVENYIREHSEASFSHSLCPVCFRTEMERLATSVSEKAAQDSDPGAEAAPENDRGSVP
ncbi:MAG: response regulator [bacterium]|nr:response regulator [bacterium]